MNRFHERPSRHAFTLTELLVVMGLIGLLSVLTLVSVRAIAKDARLSSAVNTVMAGLDNARALAMKKNTNVLVIFRPRLDGAARKKQVVDLVTAAWTGQSLRSSAGAIVDRFLPIADVPVRSLPAGIKVAGPRFDPIAEVDGFDATAWTDFVWDTQVHLPAVEQDPSNFMNPRNEVAGRIIGIMFASDGTTISTNSRSDSDWLFVDLNDDGVQLLRGILYDFTGPLPADLFSQWYENDEPLVRIVPYLAVFDDDDAREVRTNDWTTREGYWQDLVGDPADPVAFPGFITTNANRIHFNRYSGVAMK